MQNFVSLSKVLDVLKCNQVTRTVLMYIFTAYLPGLMSIFRSLITWSPLVNYVQPYQDTE